VSPQHTNRTDHLSHMGSVVEKLNKTSALYQEHKERDETRGNNKTIMYSK